MNDVKSNCYCDIELLETIELKKMSSGSFKNVIYKSYVFDIYVETGFGII